MTVMPRAMHVAQSRVSEELRRLEQDPGRLLAAGLNLVMSLPIALLIGVPTGGVGAGVILGGLLAVVVYLLMRARARATASEAERAIAEVRVDADERVALVTKQYEWAVNDVANLRDALRRAEARAVATEEPPQMTPAVNDAVPLVTRAQEGDPATTLRFESAGVAPAQIRILENWDVVGISSRTLESQPGQSAAFVVTVSERVASAVTAGDTRFTIEALVDERWRAVRCQQLPIARADNVSDKRGRVYSAAVDAVSRLVFSIAED